MRELKKVWLASVVGVVGMMALGASAAAQPLRVVATTGMVADLVTRVGADAVVVEPLMGPGVDPHLYRATASDVRRLQRADAIFYNGLKLEGRLEETLERIGKRRGTVFAVTATVAGERLLKEGEGEDAVADPHLWFDVSLWAETVPAVVAGLSKVAPARAGEFAARGEVVGRELAELHAWAVAKAAEVPEAQRVLVTSHDAYSYFGRAYGFQVVGLQGLSTVNEAALVDMAKLVDFIRERGLKAVFVESSVPKATIERIAEDAGVVIGAELFSDAMGASGQLRLGYDVGTYDGMVRYNLTAIVEALR